MVHAARGLFCWMLAGALAGCAPELEASSEWSDAGGDGDDAGLGAEAGPPSARRSGSPGSRASDQGAPAAPVAPVAAGVAAPFRSERPIPAHAAAAVASRSGAGGSRPRAEERSALLWARDAQGRAWSYWVHRDAGGPALATRRPGVVIAAGGRLWRWREQEVRLPLRLRCTSFRLGAVHGRGPGVDAYLEEVGGSRRQRVVRVPRRAAVESVDLRHAVVLEGSAGGSLLVTERVSAYRCSAHGDVVDASFSVWDAAAGRARRAPLARASLRAVEDDSLAPAMEAMRGELEPLGLLEEPWLGSLRVVRLAPLLDAGGLVLDALYAMPTSFPAGDDEWESYARATAVRTRAVPSWLAAEAATAPVEEARWLLDTDASLTVRGWSVAPADLYARFEALPGEEPAR